MVFYFCGSDLVLINFLRLISWGEVTDQRIVKNYKSLYIKLGFPVRPIYYLETTFGKPFG